MLHIRFEESKEIFLKNHFFLRFVFSQKTRRDIFIAGQCHQGHGNFTEGPLF